MSLPNRKRNDRPDQQPSDYDEPPSKRLRCNENLDDEEDAALCVSVPTPAFVPVVVALPADENVAPASPGHVFLTQAPAPIQVRLATFEALVEDEEDATTPINYNDDEAHEHENDVSDHRRERHQEDDAEDDDYNGSALVSATFDMLAPPTPHYWRLMLTNERRNRIADPDLIWRTQEGLLVPAFRDITIDWMSLVCFDFGFSQITLFHAVQIMDKYLTLVRVPRESLQLVALAAIWIACKFNETTTSARFCTSADLLRTCLNTFSLDALVDKERHILQTLNFDVLLYNPRHFLDVYLFDLVQKGLLSLDNVAQLQLLTSFFLEITLYTTSFLQFTCVSRAYAALSVALTLTAPSMIPNLPGLRHEKVLLCRSQIETLWQTISANYRRNQARRPSLFTKFDCRFNPLDALFYPHL